MDLHKRLENIKFITKFVNDKNTIENLLSKCSNNVSEVIGGFLNQHSTCGFDSPCFDKYKKDELEYVNFLECPSVEEGMFVCKKCNSKKIYTISKQIRKGDESTTVFATCSSCKHRWIV